MGQEEEAAAPAPATVVFSWEQELGVSKQKPGSTGRDDDMPESPKKAPPARRLSVPPPPGRLPLTASKSFSKARAVRPEDDPFLAAYLACTKSTGGGGGFAREPKGKRRFTWAGLGLGLGLSCKSSNGVVEDSMVKMAKRPEVNPKDA
ncbi:hypothetical protein E2562_037468 [Oryza meyeriana var. granulata]|uniref:Uncharacterized protein n=1 Tax=Oryza meyeriana var. granulata TaxID=110450 RepID=A0A6G1DVC0_9ORYZ|nr:hypothetical protein E2562_037468 [Oryza meyeriana var. granulata]